MGLLGPLQIMVNGESRELRGRKQQILLARLVLAQGKPVPVNALIEDLWDGGPPRDANSALQVHVSRLRTAIDADIEFVHHINYRLPAQGFDTDVREFTRLHDRGRAELAEGDSGAAASTLHEALALWRGPALADLADGDALRSAALRLDELRNQAIFEWVEACLDSGRADEVIGEVRSSLDRDPLQEHRWRQLILALHRCGRHGEAIEAYRQARTMFIEELGIEPGRMLEEVHTELRRLDTTPVASWFDEPSSTVARPPHMQAAVAAPRPAVPLIGRQDALDALLGQWDQCSKELRVATLSGEPGVGKSRLAAELAGQVAAAGGRVLMGRCDPTVSWPFQPFAEMLRMFVEDRAIAEPTLLDARLNRHRAGLAQVAAEVTEVLPEPTTSAAGAGERIANHRPREAIAAWLSVYSERQPLLVVIDDLHWADAETVQVLRHVLRSSMSIRALVVLVVRDRQAEVLASSGRLDSGLLGELMRQSDRTLHLPLRRLDEAETAELLSAESSSGAASSVETVEFVQHASGGNPLFILELARGLRGAGESQSMPKASLGLRQVVDDRVSLLEEATQRLLSVAAVLGSVFSITVLADLAEAEGMDRTTVDEALIDAVGAQLIEPVQGSGMQFSFSHDIVRLTVYEAIPPTRRAKLHGLIAERLQRLPVTDPAAHHHECALHLRRSDLPDAHHRAAEHLLLAGRNALSRGASQNAARLLRDGLTLLPPDAHAVLRCDMLIELGVAQTQNGEPEYRETLLEAGRLAQELGDADRVITAVLANTRGWWSSTVEIDHERVAAIETALALSDPAQASVRARLLASWAMENVRDPGSRDEVLARSAEAVQLAGHDDVALASALARRYQVLYALFEQPEECLRMGQRLLDLARRTGDRIVRLTASLCLAQANMRFGEFQVADRYSQQALQLSRSLQQPAREWLVSTWLAARAGMRGRFEQAEELARQALELGSRTRQGDASTWFAGQLFVVRLHQGRLAEILTEVGDQATEAAHAIPAWRTAMAVALVHAGQRATAAGILEEFADDGFARLPRDMLWLTSMHFLSMVCESLERDDIAPRLYDALAPYSGMVASNGTIDVGPVDLRLGALARLAGDEASARQHLTEALAMSRRMDATVWSAQAEQLLVPAP